jgi:hypothetical protein
VILHVSKRGLFIVLDEESKRKSERIDCFFFWTTSLPFDCK